MGFSVCSYNMGTDDADYNLLYRKAVPNEPPPDNFLELFARAEDAAAESLKESADVYCLQECTGKLWNFEWGKRPLFVALEKRDFQFYSAQNETAIIALDPNRFEMLSANAGEKRDRVMVVAKDLVTGKTVAFVSIWMEGFSLTNTYEQKKEEEKNQMGPYEANQMARAIVKEFEENEIKPDMEIVAGHTNATPELWPDLFDIFKERDFKVYRTNQYTQINTNEWEKAYPERELDYAFVRNQTSKLGVIEKIVEFFKSIFSMDPDYYTEWTTIGIPAAFEGWNEKANSSDHKPIILTAHREHSLLYRLGELLGCFSASEE